MVRYFTLWKNKEKKCINNKKIKITEVIFQLDHGSKVNTLGK